MGVWVEVLGCVGGVNIFVCIYMECRLQRLDTSLPPSISIYPSDHSRRNGNTSAPWVLVVVGVAHLAHEVQRVAHDGRRLVGRLALRDVLRCVGDDGWV